MIVNRWNTVYSLSLILVFLFLPLSLQANSSQPPGGYAGNPPGQQNCTVCHNSFQFNSGDGSVTLVDPPENYSPGEVYELTLELADPNAMRWGFEMTALDAENVRAGNFRVLDGNTTSLSDNQGQPQYVGHGQGGTFPGQRNSTQWVFEWTAPDEDIGEVGFYFVGNAANNNRSPSGDYIYGSSVMIEAFIPEPERFTVSLASGWNFFSSPVIPWDADITQIFGHISDENLNVLRDQSGRTYVPAMGVNEIGVWLSMNAYWIKINEAADVEFAGDYDPEAAYHLNGGWTWVSYPRLDTLHPAEAFTEIEEQLVLAKMADGNFFSPLDTINNLGMIMPGDGLMIWMTNQMEDFVFPAPQGMHEPPAEVPLPEHFVDLPFTPMNMSIVIDLWNDIMPVAGDEIAVTDTMGHVFGASVIMGDKVPLVVWGDYENQEISSGFVEDEKIYFVYYSAEGDSQFALNGSNIDINGDVVFRANDYFHVGLAMPEQSAPDLPEVTVPTNLALHGVFPNPFNSRTELQFSLRGEAEISIQIYDIRGTLVNDWGNEKYSSGSHQVSIDGADLSTGIYLVRISDGRGMQQTKRIVLLR